jgi:rfaE bifunctional protein nucleotidyltransferase chain/domain
MMNDPRKKIVTVGVLKKRLDLFRRQGKKISFTNGCFDILHWGHVSYLSAAKKNDSRLLIVGINSDDSVRAQNKGASRPIVPQAERAAVLAGLASVDFVVIFNDETPLSLIKALKPDLLLKGEDWKDKEVAGADFVRSTGGKVEFVRFVKGLSTTNIIAKVKAS